jgi:transposase-like protein
MAKLTTQPAIDLIKLMEAFDTDAECRAYLEELRWPNGVECPRCQSKKVSRIKARKVFDCDGCRYQFSVTAGTIFHDSHLPLPKWFLAIFLITESKKGVSALQLKRMLKVSYKTAWYLSHRIREAMKEDIGLLGGVVELDETYVGRKGRQKPYKGRPASRNAAMILGALQRGGKITLKVGKKADHDTLGTFIGEAVGPTARQVMTDGHPTYRKVIPQGVDHGVVDHSKEEWVRGTIHTNGIEGAWGLFKRSLVGSFHQVSVKHLDRYLNEFEFRYNNRKNAYLFRDTVMKLTKGDTLPYDKLTA